ncbi:MAG: flagellar basal-body rod protein FlgC [Solirubrobacterales bacterium]|jgi:flagellar basal-body rod protein FlgC|nr:flagellar basal-body rod protein FlgC [Solirubrobacterales bacterium]
MGLFDAIQISGSGLSAERLRMDVTAENLANAQSTRGADGTPYQRKQVVLEAVDGQSGFADALAAANGAPAATSNGQTPGVKVAAITEDPTPGHRVYDPSHPDADNTGYVTMPNVDSVTEMVDLISESRSYEANVTAMQSAKTMFSKTLDILR